MTGAGFSLSGLAVSLAILAPNLVLLWAPPRDHLPSPAIPPAVRALERVGQIGCLVLPAISGSNGPVNALLVMILLCIGVYYGLWVRYLVAGRSVAQLFAPLGPVLVPMAVFPVLAFLIAALWLSSELLAVAGIALAVGHLGTAWRTARTLEW